MALCLISNTIKDLGGFGIPNVYVTIDLVPPGAFRLSDHTEVASRYNVVTDNNGYWQQNVEQNANINPAGSYYKVTELLPASAGGNRYWIIATGSAGAGAVYDLITTPPVSPGAMVDYLTKAEGDSYYAPISAVNQIPPSVTFVAPLMNAFIIP